MILIDKNKAEQELVLTLTEKTTASEANYLLKSTNDADNSNHTIELNDYFISSNTRFDYYTIHTSEFDGMPDGYYTYSILQDGLESDVIEVGKLLITGKTKDVELITPIRTEEYLIYK